MGIFLADSLANRILLGKRKDSGLYGLPGGWLEKFEDWEECASRELKEEVNLNLPRNRFFNIETFNCRHLDKGYHAISLIMYSEIQEEEKKEIKNLEPDKCEKWFWVSFGQLRNQMNSLFYPLKDFLNKHPKMNSVDYLKGLVKTPIVSFQKQEKKKSISTQDTGSPFSASTWDDDCLLLKDDLMMI